MASSAMSLFQDIQSSNIGHGAKKALSRWMGMASGISHHNRSLAREGEGGLANAGMKFGASITTGAVLAVVAAEAKQGLDPKGVPVDGVAGVLGFVAEAFVGGPLGSGAGSIGATSAGIFTYRKLDSFLRAKRAQVHGDWTTEGDVGAESSIERMAREI